MLKKILATLCLVALTHAAILCPKNACDSITCDAKVTSDRCTQGGGRFIPNGGICGCCDHCVQLLGEGDSCSTKVGSGPAISECGENLYCSHTTNQCSYRSCAMVRKEGEEYLASVELPPPGYTLPKCDDDGTYFGKQCTGSQCYCVDVNGKEIEGYSHNAWDTDPEITCQCARDKAAYFATGTIGRFFHCSDHGDYENVQCSGAICFCADRKTGEQLKGPTVHITSSKRLYC